MLTLADRMEDGLDLEQALLGADGIVDPGLVSLSEQEDSRYAYFAYATDQSTHVLCFYLRGDAQAITLAAAAELPMTGTARAGMGETAACYGVGGCAATAERFFFAAKSEQGYLTNYRLRNNP